jgi:large repetitive protein
MTGKLSRARLLVGTLTCAITVTTAILAGTASAHAAPAPPTGLQSSGDPIPVLSWDRVDTATSYRVQGSETAGFTSLVFNQSTTNNRYVPTRVLKEGTLYWRVSATDPSGTSGYTETQTTIFEHLPPTSLTVTPANSTNEIMPPVEPPVITWDGVPGAIGYDVEMDPEGDGVGGTLKTNIKTTTYVWPDPQGVGETGGVADFFVRVRAKFDNGLQTSWSDYESYDVGQLPPVTYEGSCPTTPMTLCAPDPASPSVRSSRNVQDVILDWDPIRGAKQYEIWVSQDSTFSNTPVDRRVVSGTRYSPKVTYANAGYFWKVRAINAAGEPQPWPASGSPFSRNWPSAPTLVYPPNSFDTTAADLYFQWTPVQHATRYELLVGTDANFTPNTFSTCLTAQTTFTIGYRDDSCKPGGPLRLNQGSIYYWKVRAIDDPKGINGIFSPTWSVVYDTGPVLRLSPVNGATTSNPSLRWSLNTTTPSSAQTYRVSLLDKDGTTVDQRVTSAQSYTPTVALDPAKSPYRWGVVALGTNGHASPLYGRSSFTYVKPTDGLDPLAANPSVYGDSNARFPSLSWQPLADADYYRLRVFNAAGFELTSATTDVLREDLPHPSVTDWKSHFINNPGTYTYGVNAYDVTDNGIVLLGSTSFADRGTFTIGALPPVSGQQIALDGVAVDAGQTCDLVYDPENEDATTCGPVPATPVLDWDPVPGAGGYMVYLFEESNLTTPVYDPTKSATENTRWTPDEALEETLAENDADSAYYWFVRPCVSIAPFAGCGPDPESLIDAATGAFRKASPPVVLTSPADNSVAADEITFTWEDYRTTNDSYPSWPAGGTKSSQSAMTYRIQVASSATITDANAIDDQIVDQTTYTAYTDLYAEGDLWWRVQAIDAAGHRLAFSETRKVVKATPSPNLDPDTNVSNERPYVDTSDPVACRAARPNDTVPCNTFPSWGAQVAGGEFAFSWPAETFDSTFALEVYRNNDTSGSAANRVVSLTGLKQAAGIGPRALAPSATPSDTSAYRWRIRRTDAYGNHGPWSDYGKFWVLPAPVVPESPAAGASQPPNGPLLKWQQYAASSGQAHHYRVDITNTATNAALGSIAETSATSFAPTVSYPTGTYRWVVTAYDASDNVLGTSPTGVDAWTFTVDTSLGVVSPTEIHAPDGAQVAKVLTSTPPTWSQPGVTSTYQWLRNGTNINGATGTTYEIVAADVGKALSLRVTGKKPGFTDTQSTSTPLTANPGDAVVPTEGPSISGVAAARETLTVDPGTWPSGTKFTYQWFVGREAVAKATASKYVVRNRDAGLPIYARVTGTLPGYVPGEANSNSLTAEKLPTTLTAALQANPISKRSRAKVEVSLSLVDFGVPLGSVQVRSGQKVLATTQVKNSSAGKMTIRLKKLKPGAHKLTLLYTGSASTAASKMKGKLKLVVLKR